MEIDVTNRLGALKESEGIDGLRVADASIIPRIPNANLHAVALMIGEKAAAMIASQGRAIAGRGGLDRGNPLLQVGDFVPRLGRRVLGLSMPFEFSLEAFHFDMSLADRRLFGGRNHIAIDEPAARQHTGLHQNSPART